VDTPVPPGVEASAPAAGVPPGDPGEVRRARNAVATAFTLAGFAVATWIARIPNVRDALDLTPGQLGTVLLVGAVGSVIALPTAGPVINRVGAARTVAGAAVLAGAGLALAGLGAGSLASVVAVAAGLFAVFFGASAWDVAMNVEGAEVERRLGRTLMPRLHAGFSLGTVIGAGLGAAAIAVGVPVPVHLGAVGLATAAVAVGAARRFLPAAPPPAAGEPAAARPSVWSAWRESRTLLIGVLVFAFALGEGIAYDWLALGLIDGFGVSAATGAIGFAVFVTAMTACRMLGTAAIDRYGRAVVLRVTAGLAAAGVLAVVFGGSLPVALAGAAAWGVGTALGFPLGMSAAAADPRRAAVRVSVVSSIAYTAFLAGPPLLGGIGDRVGVQRALLVAGVAMLIGAAVAGVARTGRRPPRRPALRSRRR
jgi:fucose permease